MAAILFLTAVTMKVLLDKICLMVMEIFIGLTVLNTQVNGKMDINKD
jgi:hypothetical protein